MNISISFTARYIRAENMKKVGQANATSIDFIFQTPNPDSQYDLPFKVGGYGEKADNFVNGVAPGAVLTIHVNIKGGEWQGKTFTNLDLWKWEAAAGVQATQPQPQQHQAPQAVATQPPVGNFQQPVAQQQYQQPAAPQQASPAAPVKLFGPSEPNPPKDGSVVQKDQNGYFWSYVRSEPHYFDPNSGMWINHATKAVVAPDSDDLPF